MQLTFLSEGIGKTSTDAQVGKTNQAKTASEKEEEKIKVAC